MYPSTLLEVSYADTPRSVCDLPARETHCNKAGQCLLLMSTVADRCLIPEISAAASGAMPGL